VLPPNAQEPSSSNTETNTTRLPHAQSTAYSTNPAIAASELRNPETNAAFYVVMHAYSPSATLDTFQLKVNTSAGEREFFRQPYLSLHLPFLTTLES